MVLCIVDPMLHFFHQCYIFSDRERREFHQVIIEMKTTFSGGESLSEYDIFVDIHRFANAPGAHEGPGFLPWHREYLNR